MPHAIGRFTRGVLPVVGIAYVQDTVSGFKSSSATANITMGSNVSVGDLLIASIAIDGFDATDTISTGGATANVSWSPSVTLVDSDNGITTEIWAGKVSGTTTSPPEFTMTNSGTPNNMAFNISEWSDIKATGYLDETGTSTEGDSSTTFVIPSLSQTVGNELFMGVANAIASGTIAGPTGGWIGLQSLLTHGIGFGYFIAPDAGAYSSTYTASSSRPYDTVSANYKHA